MKASILALLALVSIAIVGCQPHATKTTREVAPAIGVDELRAAGLADLEAGRYDNALRAFVEGLSRAPEDVKLHYLVGVTFAQLQRRDDAIIAFRWVLEHGRPGSKEVQGASQWLADNGMLPTATAAAASTDEEDTAGGAMEGRTDWPGLDPERPLPQLQMQLEGTGLDDPEEALRDQDHAEWPLQVPQGEARRLPPARPVRLHAPVGHAGDCGREDDPDLTQDNAIAPKDAIKTKS